MNELSAGSRDPMVGRIVADRYRLESLLGTGAVGNVYLARHLLIDRSVAIKILCLDPPQRDLYRAWFLREARAVNLVNHANVAEVYDYGETPDGLVYLVMELLVGERLSDRVAHGPLDVPFCLRVVEQTAAALARAHDLGVVHRDLKPEHVFLVERAGRRDFVKLIDFGLAHILHEGRLALEGAILGTPAYISPEQARGEDAGPQADLYSLGVVLFEMVTGRLPFVVEGPQALLECHRLQPPPDPCELRADLDPEVGAMIARLLAKELTRRYRDAHHLNDDCKAIQRRLAPVSRAHSEVPGAGMPGRPALSPAAASSWALRASLLGRMAAAAYPAGGGPVQITGTVGEIWRLVAELARLDGELQVLAGWDDNLHQRARESASRLGREVEELSRLGSRLRREMAEAATEVDQLQAERQQTEEDLLAARATADAVGTGGKGVREALEAAGAAAARLQWCADALDRTSTGIRRRELSCQQAEAQARRLRDQLEREASGVERDLALRQPRYADLLKERQELLATLRRYEESLGAHFNRRSECRNLLAELEAVAAEPGPGPSASTGALV